MTNRIFININFGSELVYYIFISLPIEMLFDVANIWVIMRKNHF